MLSVVGISGGFGRRVKRKASIVIANEGGPQVQISASLSCHRGLG
jgi:hypothetical protein